MKAAWERFMDWGDRHIVLAVIVSGIGGLVLWLVFTMIVGAFS